MLYLGRGPFYPIALEGALKLKELSYIHAEGYAAGELKHGPLALVDEHMPVVVIAPSGELLEKTLSNLQEVAARGGSPIILITDEGGGASAHAASKVVLVPPCDPLDRADGLRGPDPAARLPHRRAEGHGRGPAAQPRQVRHG